MFKTILRQTARVLVTLIVVAVAIYFGRQVWKHYMEKPWTRDGRVRATIVTIAPDVSGIITGHSLKDNQSVRKGDLLFTIDTARYQLALDQATATAKASSDALIQRRRELERRRALLTSAVITQEALEQAENAVLTAESTLQQSEATLETARLNLARTEVRSPVNGYITNLQIDTGDYATAGKAMLAIVNSDSLYVAGYFEETKIQYIKDNAPVTIKLMGYSEPVMGHVESIAPAIVDRENTAGTDLVANVNPSFAWVRLAQRIPVRIAIDKVPENVRLTAGMTATIVVEETPSPQSAK